MKGSRAALVVSAFLALASLASAVVPGLDVRDAQAQYIDKPERQCRQALANGSRLYLERVIGARMRCYNRVLRGSVPYMDCLFGDGDAKVQTAISVYSGRVDRMLANACSGVNLKQLNFPGACPDNTPDTPFDTIDLGRCIIDQSDGVIAGLLAQYYPEPYEVLHGKRSKCVRGSARDALAMFRSELRVRDACLMDQSIFRIDESVDCRNEILPYGPGTGDSSVDTRLGRAYIHLLGGIPGQCARIRVDQLGYQNVCSDSSGGIFTTVDLKQCLFDLNRDQMPVAVAIPFPTAPVCGNGVVEGDEECDDGNESNTDACLNTCLNATCGDGFTWAGVEQCDDGNTLNTDGCLDTCVNATCGDGFIWAGVEQCDDGNTINTDACPSTCKNAICGDGFVQTGVEQCDDGNSSNTDSCLNTCTTARCGDGFVQTGVEQCDDANSINTDACLNTCRNATCGDGFLWAGVEQCDDGNTVDTDACPSTCKDAFCGDGFKQTGVEQCDDGNTSNTDACLNTCKNAKCGDGFTHIGVEQCDDANSVNTDSCTNACMNAACGDGFLQTVVGEECDDGNTVDSDGCTHCRICGNGIVTPPEQCDGVAGTCGAGESCTGSCVCGQACPGFGELTLYSGVGGDCATNADCPAGQCDSGSGRCQTVTQLDSGWTGLSHDADINNLLVTRGFIECAGAGPLCGVCDIVGIDPSTRACRCNNDTRKICDKPFQADADNCGGATCDCYFGAPFPLSSAGTPACIVNRFSEDISGTANVDLGAGQINANLRTQVFLGITTIDPCPVCGGTCSDNPSKFCVRDEDCTAGTCQLDPVMDDGVRGGVCTDGRNQGLSCDVTALNTSFPAYPNEPGGGGYSLDCLPDIGKNVSGAGLIIKLSQTTGTTSLNSNLDCGDGLSVCPCLQCTTDTSAPCNSNADCASQSGACSKSNKFLCTGNSDCAAVNAGTCLAIHRCSLATAVTCTTNADCNPLDVGTCSPSTCSSIGAGTVPAPNFCDGLACTDIGGGEGECTTGPNGLSCDAVVRANGDGILSCAFDADCAPQAVGFDAGTCTLSERRKCFLNPIVATGHADPTAPVGAAAFCIPATSSPAINNVAGLPGPGRTINQATSKLFCASDPNKRYIPGVGGCLD